MSVNLITGNLFSPIQASQDSDYQAGTFGEKTQILNVGSKMAVSIVDNSTIRCKDGVLVTREGRRVQIDNGDVVEWTIPTGTQGTTSYYIVGFRLYTDDESAQLCDTFVQSVSGPGATITEDTFRDGAVEIFVSVARVVQNGITLESVESLVPVTTTLEQAKEDISQINSDISDINTLLGNTSIASIGVGTVTGAVSQINSDLTKLRLAITTRTQAYSITSTSQTAGYYYQHLSIPSEIGSANRIYCCMLVDNAGVGTVVSMIVDISSNYIDVRYTQAPNNGKITLRFLYDDR